MSVFMSFQIKTPFLWVLCCLFLTADLLASKKTLDADGGADFSKFDDALASVISDKYDTLLIIGADKDSFTWDYTANSNIGTLVIRSTHTNPDSFPVITKTGGDHYNFLANNNLYIENVIFDNSSSTSDYVFRNGQASGKIHKFKNCVIRNQSTSDYFFQIEGSNLTTTIFENCLFHNNNRLIQINYYGSNSTVIKFINCTFDNNGENFSGDEDKKDSISFVNCIFSNNTTTFPGNNLRSKVTYSVTTEPLTGYGASCTSAADIKYVVSSSRTIPSHWKVSGASPAANRGTSTGAPITDIGGVARSGGYEAGCWEIFYSDYTWDISTSAGIQAGGGTWGSSNYWTVDGTNLQPWMGRGNTATFAGSDGAIGAYVINVSGTQDVDSISFNSSGYALNGGTLNFGTLQARIQVAPSRSTSIGSAITGNNGFKFNGGGILTLTGTSSFTGVLSIIDGGTLVAGVLANGGSSSSIGAASSDASNFIIADGKFQYSGSGSSTNRLFTIGPSGATISASGSGAVNFTNTGSVGLSGTGDRTLVLQGSNSGLNTLSAIIGESGGVTSVHKKESGKWVLSGTNTYTGITSISGGTLQVSSLANGGVNSGIGASSNSASNLLINGGSLLYAGAAANTDRLFSIGTGGATIEGSGSGAINFTNTLSTGFSGLGSRTLTLGGTNTGNNTFATLIGDNGGATSLVKTGSGTWLLTASNSFTGSVTLNGGTLSVSSITNGGINSNIGASSNSASNLVINGGTLLYTGGASSSDRLLTIGLSGATLNASGTGALKLTNTGTAVISGAGTRNLTLTGTNSGDNTFNLVISNNGGATSLTKSGPGTWIIGGSNTFSGNTVVNGGLLVFTGNGSVYNNGSQAVSIIINGSGTIRLDRNDFLGDYTSQSPTSVVINSGGTLASNNSFTTLYSPVLNGGTLLSNGGYDATWPAFALKGVVNVTGTSTSYINSGAGSNNRIMVGDNTNGGITEFNVSDNAAGNDLVISTVLCDIKESGGAQSDVVSGITKTGAGTLELSGSNNYRGPTNINNGTVIISSGGSVYSGGTFAGTIILNNGGTLRFDRSNTFGDHLSTPAATITIHSGGNLQSNSTFTTLRNLSLNGGTVTLNGGDAALGAFALKGTVNAYGTVPSTIASGAGSNNFILIGTNTANGVTTFDVADNASGNDLVVAATLTDNKGADPYPNITSCLRKIGPGTMVLSSVNTYTGTTTIDNGTLLVNGSISSINQLTVNGSATLGGSGIVGSPVFVANNGALAPGNNGIGTLTTGSIVLSDSSLLNFELGPVALSDKIVVSQGSANLTVDGVLNISASAGFGLGTYTLLTCTGTLTDNSLSLGTVPSGYNYALQVEDKEVKLVVSEINVAPTNLTLSSKEVFAGKPINTVVGLLSSEDFNSGENFTYSLVSGTGDNDNASFNINGNELRTSAVFNYDVKNSYSIRIRTTDHAGLYYEKTFTITVVVAGTGLTAQYFDNSNLTELKMTRVDNTIDFDWGTGSPDVSIGVDGFSVRWAGQIRPEKTETYTFYALVNDGLRLWVNDILVIDQWNFYTGEEYSGQISLTGGIKYKFKVEYFDSLTSANVSIKWGSPSISKEIIPSTCLYPIQSSAPTDISLSGSSVYEDRPVGTTVGTFTTTDPDAGDSHTYSLVNGIGSADNNNFKIDGNILKTNAVLHYNTKSTHNIRVRTTDASGLVYEESFIISVNSDPSIVTIDEDGGADYSSLNALIIAIKDGANPTTVLFTGSDVDTFTWSEYIDRQMSGPLILKGAQTNPDMFPVLNHTHNDYYNFLKNLEITFENLVLTGSFYFKFGEVDKPATFKNCVIRDFSSSYIFLFEGNKTPTITYENCLFEGNTGNEGIFKFSFNGGTPTINIINCTFDNNTKVFYQDLSYGTNHTIKNCIFSNNGTIFPGNILRGKTTYSITSEEITNYGTGCIKSTDIKFVSSNRIVPSDWRLQNSSPARNMGNSTGAPVTDISGSSRSDGYIDAGCWEVVPLYWDLQTTSGIQSGDGTWGINNYWTREGTKLQAWPGAGNTAIFAGKDSTYTITVSGTQSVDSIVFLHNGYTLNAGTLSMTGGAGIYVAASKNATVNSVITGSKGLKITGGGILNLSGTNTYSGVTSITGGSVLSISSLSNGGQNCAIGSASNIASNLIINNGTLKYTGNTIDTDRLFSIGNNGCSIDASGTGLLNFTNSGTLSFDGSGPRTLTLTGTGSGRLSSKISDNGSPTSVVKSGSGTWTIAGTNTYSGITDINAGKLILTGTIVSTTTVRNGATLTGNGTISGAVAMEDNSYLIPGNNGTGHISTGSLMLSNSTKLQFELGTQRDSVKVNGDLTLDGVLNITTLNGFTAGSYTLFTYTGSITDNGLTVGTAPHNYSYSIAIEGNRVVLQVKSHAEMLPITVKHNIDTLTSSDTCLIYTDNWSIIFDEDNGGQIKFLSNQPNGAGDNQVWKTDQRNLFYVQYNTPSYSTSGNLKILEQTSFYIVLQNSYTLSGVQFVEQYTVYGSGKIFLRITAVNQSGSDKNEIMRLVTVRSHEGSSVRKAANATPSLSTYLLNAESASGQFDILFCLNEPWPDANGFYNVVDQNSTFGFEANTYKIPNKAFRSWDCMIDFSQTLLNDTSSATTDAAKDYQIPDSLQFITGASALDDAWEVHLWGHWRFDETSGTTAHNWANANHHGTTDGSWISGIREGALQTTYNQKVTVSNHSDFNADWHFTIMAWVKTTSLDNTASIIGKHNGSNGWRLTGNGTGKVRLLLNGTSFDGRSIITDNKWHHIAASFSIMKDTVKIYVDGKIDTIIQTDPNLVVNTNLEDLIMGGNFTGALDDIRYYNNLPGDEMIRSVYLNNYNSAKGVYTVRADNNNMLHLLIDGGSINRNFPIFHIRNYWASSLPAAGSVKINGVTQIENTDYYAYLDDAGNILTIGFNKIIYEDNVRIYIDDAYDDGYQMIGSTKKMYWGRQNNGAYDYFWVKNFKESSYGDADDKQFYLNWKMSPSGNSKDGDIWFLGSSVSNPNSMVDTVANTNHIPDGANGSMGSYSFNLNGNYPLTSENTSNTFNYTVKESSDVRVVLRINERTVANGNSFKIKTEYTIYPTGQIFKWDSIYQFTTTPLGIFAGAYMDKKDYSSVYLNKNRKRGGVIYSQSYQDFAFSWLSMKNSNGVQAQPFDSDTMRYFQNDNRVGVEFVDLTATSQWNATPVQSAMYIDIQHAKMNSAYIDSVSNSVQYIGINGGAALAMKSGLLMSGDSSTPGDLNGDGFNEREGAYVIKASNNTIEFTLPAKSDTCRFYPAFKIINYSAVAKPEYVFLYRGKSNGDTVTILENYQYNAYLNLQRKELIFQIDSVFCDSVNIYLSADRTLAVKMSGFWAAGGLECDTIGWSTESEKDNMGFLLYRRIKPDFFVNHDKDTDSSDLKTLMKQKVISSNDTAWAPLNTVMIPGASSGVSFGRRDYRYIDKKVHSYIVYEYKLVSIDYYNHTEEFGPVEAMPRPRIPLMFRMFNYPNPFRNSTSIQFELPYDSPVTLDIYNLQGRLIKRLISPDVVYKAGFYKVQWDGSSKRGNQIAAGTYIYRMTTQRTVKSRMMFVVR